MYTPFFKLQEMPHDKTVSRVSQFTMRSVTHRRIFVKRRRLPYDLPVTSILAEKVRTTHIHSVASNSLIAAQSVVALTSDAINEAINTIQNSNVSGII